MSLADSTLLERFVATRDEAAFRALVDRHLDHVHSVARRITGSDDLARDVAQSTFLRLAERAALIPRQLALPAWLHQTSRSFAISLVRAEDRRKRREIRAADQFTMNASPEASWSQLAPVIDELVERLPESYRDIVLYRFYHNQSHAMVAAKLGLTEETARKRSARALEKLRASLGRRGITTTSLALSSLLPLHASTPAPTALAGSVMLAASKVVPLAKGGSLAVAGRALASHKTGITVVALVAAAFAIPYAAGWLDRTPPASTVASLAATPEAAPAARRPRSPRPAALSAEERFQRLKEILVNSDPLVRRRDLLSFLDGMPVNLFEETAENFRRLNNEERRPEFALAMLAWARLDLAAARDFAERRAPRESQEIIAWWAGDDPQAALKWARENPRMQGMNVHFAAALEGVARTDLKRAVELAGEAPNASEQGELLRWVLYSRLGRDRDAASKMLALVSDPQLQQAVIGAAANYRAGANPDESLRLLLEHPEAIPQASPLSIYNAWAGQDLAAATASLEHLPTGDLLKGALGVVARETALRSPRRAFELLDQHAEVVDDAMVRQIVDAAFLADPVLALEGASRATDEAARNSLYVTTLRKWMEQDEAAARAWMTGHRLPDEVEKKLSLR